MEATIIDSSLVVCRYMVERLKELREEFDGSDIASTYSLLLRATDCIRFELEVLDEEARKELVTENIKTLRSIKSILNSRYRIVAWKNMKNSSLELNKE